MPSMPLACGYLAAMLRSDPDLKDQIAVQICNYGGAASGMQITMDLLAEPPDVAAFSVLGWSYRRFGEVARAYKQVRPDGLVVFGGNHVAYQAARVFREYPEVDVIANGEGEYVFKEIITEVLACPAAPQFQRVAGISWNHRGELIECGDAERISDLDGLPSPILSGVMQMQNQAGEFLYDAALMETNRGCPYKCSFCYWGGAIGQRVRQFSRERLQEELEFIARLRVNTLVLCDANFGMLEADEQFVEDLIRTRERFGWPRSFETSWAKNKSERFYRIVEGLGRHKFQSSFTLALQSLSEPVLRGMNRRNMPINKWEALSEWLHERGFACYGELIWGAPGETRESFYDSYDRFARRLSRIAVYPLLVLPNTEYHAARESLGLVTVRGCDDDFEYVVASASASVAEHAEVHRFMFWARLLGENSFFRHLIHPATTLARCTQSQLFESLRETLEGSKLPEVKDFIGSQPALADSRGVIRALRRLYTDRFVNSEIADWWRFRIVPRFPPEWQPFALGLYEYETWCRPLYVAPGGNCPTGWRPAKCDGSRVYVSDPVEFEYDFAKILASWHDDAPGCPPAASKATYRFTAPAGYYDYIDNHEASGRYAAVAELISGPVARDSSNQCDGK